MKNLTRLFFLFTLISLLSISCQEDPEDLGCVGALDNGGSLEVDGVKLNLSVAQLLISGGFEGDNYLFQVAGLSDNCEDLTTINFSAEITENSDFDGTYDIVDFFDAGLNDVSSFTITSSSVSTGQQSLVEIDMGSMAVEKIADKEYKVDMAGTKVGGGTVEVYFQSGF